MVVRVCALCALLWLSQPLASQVGVGQEAEVLDPSVIALVENALATDHPESQADALWQAAAAAHGEVRLLVDLMQVRIASKKEPGASRLLCGILRYQGQPRKALRVLDGIALGQRRDGDLLLRAELLDTLSRGDDAARAYDELLKKQLEPALRRRILFRRALVGSDSIAQLKAFAQSPELDRDHRNQAAIILALRNEPAAALELYDVQGEGTERFRQLVRIAEWALAAEDYKKAQESGWEAVQVAKMKRDRRYALTVVVSAYRAGDAIDALLKRLEASPELKDDARQVWIDLLRDEGRVDDALRLFRQGSSGDQASKGGWTPALRRQLLEICRETGREDVLIAQFRELMVAEPGNLEWRSGLSRYFLENGDRAQAKAAWADFGKGDVSSNRQLEAAYSLMDLGLDDLALRAAGIAAASEDLRETAQLFIVKLHVDRGRFDEASSMLVEIEGKAGGKDAVLAEVAGIYERMDRLDRAVQVLDRMRKAYGGFLGTDLDMKYALLLSKVNREHDALTVWRSLWSKVRSTPRGRYVEDRMMTVAARLGVLAKIAIELEDKLDAGTADTTDVELLVRLYVKVGDSAAATEITEQALRKSDAADLDIIRRKATIYLACQDYLEYERLIQQLIERDTENRLDHMRELTLSRLERGRRAQAIEQLPALRAAEDDSGIADEFEAGIYQLAGLMEPALKSYVKGLGRFPDRIDTHLLVANLMRETGREMEAARRFQYLASTAKRDDLFTIAIDGILNLRSQDDTQVPKSVVDWAMRVTLERLAERSHRFYLHRLAADLAEEMNDMPMSIRTLTAGIPVAGERRTALLREILGKVRSLDKNARVMFGGSRRQQISPEWDAAPYVMIGRRLLGQGEIVPPQVYMDLAAIFLHVKAVPDAMRTFSRAAELLDRGEVHRQAAAVLEQAERYDGALQFYRRLLSVDANDVGLLVKIGRLEELAGRDEAARSVYEQGLAAALRQTAPRVHVAVEEEPDPDDIYSFLGRQRSVDAITTALPKLLEGLLVTMSEEHAVGYLQAMQKQVEQDLQQVTAGGGVDEGATSIDQFPRLATRADILRRLCLCYRQLPIADAIDKKLLQRFPTDRALAKASIGHRAARGFHVSAGRLTEASEFRNDPNFAWLASSADLDGPVPPAIAAARVVPLLVEDPAKLRAMLDNVDAAAFDVTNLGSVPVLLGACAVVGAVDAGERIARAGVRISATLSRRDQIQLGANNAAGVINLASRLNPELKDRLRQYRLQRTAAKGPKALVAIQFELEGQSDMLLDAEVVEQMLRSEVANSAQEQFGLRSMGLMFFLPPERRSALLRELYTAAPASQRLNVLAQGADFIEEPLSDSYIEWFTAVFEREFAETDKRQRRNAGFSFSSTGSVRLKRARLEVAIKLGGSHREWLRLLQLVAVDGDLERAKLMLEQGIPEMLVRDDLAGLIPNRPKAFDRGQVERAMGQIAALGLRDVTIEIVEAKLKKLRRHEALLFMQWLLRTEMPGSSQFVADATATEKAKTDVDLLERLFKFEQKRGRLVEASETLQRLIEVDKKSAKRWPLRLAAMHSRLGNLEAAEKLRSDEGRVGGAEQPVSVGAKVAVMLRVLSVSGTAPRSAQATADLAKLKEGDDGRVGFRRKWRGQDNGRVIYSPLFPRANISLTPASLEAVQGKDFVAGEALRMVRLLEDAGQLGSQSLLGALLQVLPKASDPEAACEQHLENLAAGYGGTAESVSLLVSLATDELPDELRERIVAALLLRREVPDEARMRSIADELVRMDRSEPAAHLYRLAVLAASGGRPLYLMRGKREKPAEVIKSVQERLGGDLGRTTAIAMVDDKLAVNDDAEMVLAALESWATLLSEEELQARVLELHQEVSKLRIGRRTSYSYQQKVVPLSGAFCKMLLRAGKIDEAMAELRHLLCLPIADAYGRTPLRNARQGVKQQIEELLAIESPGQDQWLKMITAQALQWHQEGTLVASVEMLGLLGVKAGEAGFQGLAASCAEQLVVLAVDDTLAEQQLAYLRRAAGDIEGAWILEKKMLAQRRLAVEDHARVLTELYQRDGISIAFAAGNKALGYTTHEDVLTVMIQFADELSETDRATTWRELLESRKAKQLGEKSAAAIKPERG